MVAETRAYFRELLDKDLDASHLVKSDFAMLNEKLADHYGIPGVSGSQIRRVPLPPDCPRGGLPDAGGDPEGHGQRHDDLAGAARRVRDGPPARPAARSRRRRTSPPSSPTSAGRRPSASSSTSTATTRRCAGVPREDRPARLRAGDLRRHRRVPRRATARSATATRRRAGKIDPFIGIGFKLGPPVDPSGALPDGRKFRDIRELQALLAADRGDLLKNLARQWLVYATGRELAFRDREAIDAIASRAEERGGGIRTLLHEVIQDPLFQAR